MFLKKLFGTSSTRYIKKISPEIQKINDFYDGLSSKSDQDLADRTNELKKIITSPPRYKGAIRSLVNHSADQSIIIPIEA